MQLQRLKTLMDSAQYSSDELFKQMQKADAEQNKLKDEAKRMKEVLKLELDAVRVKECGCIINICCLEKGSPTDAVAFLGGRTPTLNSWRDSGGQLQRLRALQSTRYAWHTYNYIDKIKEKYYMS